MEIQQNWKKEENTHTQTEIIVSGLKLSRYGRWQGVFYGSLYPRLYDYELKSAKKTKQTNKNLDVFF